MAFNRNQGAFYQIYQLIEISNTHKVWDNLFLSVSLQRPFNANGIVWPKIVIKLVGTLSIRHVKQQRQSVVK